MPAKSSGAPSNPVPTRASTRNKLTSSASLAVTENVPIRTTRSTRTASASGGPARATAAKAQSNGTSGISVLISKKLRPLAERNVSNAQVHPAPEPESGAAVLAATKKALRPVTAGVKPEDREPIKAYLRVRPDLSNDTTSKAPYLTLLSDSEVQMAPPTSILAGMTSIRIPNPSTRRQNFSFTKVLQPEASQSDIFTTTTLPLVKDVLHGENGLIFAYGVTNSGKTFTIQGKSGDEQSGILPRALDVIFNSIEGHQDSAQTAIISREIVGADDVLVKDLLEESQQTQSPTRDSTVVPIDPSWTYRVSVSYAEIYNNQIYDLLNTAPSASDSQVKAGASKSSVINISPSASSNVRFLPTSILNLNPFSWIGGGGGGVSHASRQNLGRGSITTVSRQALTLRSDPLKGGKYIANLSEVPVSSAEEARKVMVMGQVNRRVFGTVANKESSRSHAVFTIRVERLKRDLKNGTEIVDCGRLSIVDLAGSERNKNTQAAGERMDEANKINSSLMVLGQCMRILRNNQKKLSKTHPGGRPVRTEIPPYRMSKLTELFQEFFEGRGRAAMIVNVNPFDTGYHENAAVMEFSALASEVSTVTTKLAPALSRKLSFTSNSDRDAATPRVSSHEPPTSATVRQVRLSLATPGELAPVERVIEVVEEAEECLDAEEECETEEDDTLISQLFEELEAMRQRWIDAEIRCAVVEAETRESVMQEMEERMKDMERMHIERLKRETEENELKMDLKIEMLSHAGALGSQPLTDDEYEETDEDDFERSIVERSLIVGRGMSESPSPPEVKRVGKRFALSDGPDDINPSVTRALPDAPPLVLDSSLSPESARAIVDDDGSDPGEDEQSDEDEWLPPPNGKHGRESGEEDARRRSKPKRPKVEDDLEADASGRSTDEKAKLRTPTKSAKAAPCTVVQHQLLLSQDETLDEPIVVPNRKARAEALGNNADKGGRTYVPDVGEVGAVKKKKRHFGGKAPVLTEDDILQVAAKADTAVSRGGARGSVRRLDRNSK